MPANDERPRSSAMGAPDDAEHRRGLNRELRAAFLAGAEERMLREKGRGLTEDELPALLERYPGDLPEA